MTDTTTLREKIEALKLPFSPSRNSAIDNVLDILDAHQPDPDHTDLSWAREICDDPKKLDAFMEAHPLPEQPAPDAVAEAAERVARYLSRRKKSRSDDPEDIHGYDVSPEGGYPLRTSDLETLVNLAQGTRP